MQRPCVSCGAEADSSPEGQRFMRGPGGRGGRALHACLSKKWPWGQWWPLGDLGKGSA